MSKHIVSIPRADYENWLADENVRGAFDYKSMPAGVVGVSNKSNLVGEGVPLDAFLAGPVSNTNPTALPTGLTNYSVGYRDRTDLRTLLNRIAPLVPAGETFKYRKYSDKAEFNVVSDGQHKRAIGARKFAEIKRSATIEDGSVDEKGLSIFVDKRLGGFNAPVQRRYVEHLQNILLRTDLLEVFTLLDANDTAESSINWGTANAVATPDKDLLGFISNSGDSLGQNPTVLVMGGAFSLYRKQSILDAQRDGSTGAAYFSDEQLAQFLELDDVVSIGARYQSSTTAKSKVGGANAFTYYLEQAATLDDPSSVKRAYDSTMGSDFTVFIETLATGVLITVWHANKILCPSTIGLRKQPVTYTAS